ncbi:sulfatase-like hydrolase/transferase [Anatilimnocola sp. NA78]|uniref:sulfatase-like hydrolase/transferase n=1 Tax=Anatilimnocola sp. NA78 TaxID=3415683 RepID=UPI003CE4FF01
MRLHAFTALILLSVATLFTGGPSWAADNAPAGRQPNIVVVMADDFGYECVAANGGESYQTPNLDQLATSGVRFTHCHVQPLCTPTRVQLMTGQYNVRNYFNFGTLPRQETTFANRLKKAGYATGICGKWQLGRETDSPQHFGFDEACLWQHTRRPPRFANPGLEYNGVAKDFHNGEYGPQLINDFALEFVTKHKDRPFLLYYPMMLTHNPFQPTPDSADWDPKTMGEKEKQNPKYFADMVTYMDKMVGRLVAKLDELKIRDNTLLIFIGDNGTNSGITSKFQGQDYRGGKGTTTARGTHVPLIVSWPATIKSGKVDNSLISSTDVLPTICAAAGAKIAGPLDGVSFLPQLRGEKGQPREWLYCWYSPRQQQNLAVKECAFNQHYKLYRTGEFFDLQADPFEQKPLERSSLTERGRAQAAALQKVLDQFTNARPAQLDRKFQASGGGDETPKKKNKNKQQQDE